MYRKNSNVNKSQKRMSEKNPKNPKKQNSKDDATVKSIRCPNRCGATFTSVSNANQHAR